MNTWRASRWLSGKRFACQCRRLGLDPWVWKVSWRRKWQPTPVYLTGKSRGQRSLVGYSSWGHKESDTTSWLNNSNEYMKYTRDISKVRSLAVHWWCHCQLLSVSMDKTFIVIFFVDSSLHYEIIASLSGSAILRVSGWHFHCVMTCDYCSDMVNRIISMGGICK